MHCRAIPNCLFVKYLLFEYLPSEKKRNYMTYLLGFNIAACAWRLLLHVKVNIMLADRR